MPHHRSNARLKKWVICTAVTEKEWAEFGLLAEKRGTSKAKLVKEFIEEELRKDKEPR